tara:strand:- start:4703 stop:5401 length:699 start_codon:yes stop_codon:yes gene_type:complete
MSKIFESSTAAVADIHDGASILIGGFGICGMAHNLCAALSVREKVGNFHLISNAGGMDNWGVGLLFEKKQVSSIIASRVGPACKAYEDQVMREEIKIEICPQGTFSERIRAGGSGIGGFFTPTGAGTVVAENKESRVIDGVEHIFENPIKADFSLIRAWKADENGNLLYRQSARNFNPIMATASKITIVEVEEILPVGSLNPDEVHTPGIFVDRIVKGEDLTKPIEILKIRK